MFTRVIFVNSKNIATGQFFSLVVYLCLALICCYYLSVFFSDLSLKHKHHSLILWLITLFLLYFVSIFFSAFLSNIPCVLNIKTCNSTELFRIMKFREKTLHALRPVIDSNHTALFADACLVHTKCVINALLTSIQVDNVTIDQAFVNWYRRGVDNRLRIDCSYPCNLSCPKHYRI